MDQEALTRKSIRQYQENTCNVCHNQFSLSNRPVICSKCFQKTCKLHITSESSQNLCETCMRLELKRMFVQEKEDLINVLKNDLRSLQHREKANKKEIFLKTESISKLENVIKTQQETFNAKLKDLENIILQESKQIQINNNLVAEINQLIEHSRLTQKNEHEKFANATTELIKIQKDFGAIKAEHESLKLEEDRLKDENNKMITFQRIRTITCIRCYNKIILSYKDQIINILSRKEQKELIQSVLSIRISENDNITISPCKCHLF